MSVNSPSKHMHEHVRRRAAGAQNLLLRNNPASAVAQQAAREVPQARGQVLG